MSVESALYSLLEDLVDGRCFPDVTPDTPVFPLIIYQVVGGTAYDYLERKIPDSENYRVQLSVWAKTRLQASDLALRVRQRIIEQGTAFRSAQTMGQAISLHEDSLKIYGCRQDFGIWIKVR